MMKAMVVLAILTLPLGGCALVAAGAAGAVIGTELARPGWCYDFAMQPYPCGPYLGYRVQRYP